MDFLELNLQTILFEILNFLVLAWLLNTFVFKRIMQSVRQRAAEKEALIQDLEAQRQAAAAARAEIEARLANVETEARALMVEARESSEAERQALLRETQMEVERVLAEAYVDAYRIRQQALEEFREELVHTILHISGSVISQLATDEMQVRMVKQLTDRIWEMGRSEMPRVESFRRSLGERTPTAYITTAHPLSSEQQGLLARTFAALADRNVNLEIRVDPQLAVGLQVRLGDVIVDNSVAGQLEALREQVEKTLQEHVADE